MKIDIKIDDKFNEDIIEIRVSKISDELRQIVDFLNKMQLNNKIYGTLNNKTYPIDFENLINIFVCDKQVLARMKNNEKLVLDYKLYQLEEMLDLRFVRISKSEIINLNYIDYLTFEANGMIKIYFKDNSYTYSSRKYLASLKERLKL